MKAICTLLLGCCIASASDTWTDSAAPHPAQKVGSTNDFASLRAEVIANRLRILTRSEARLLFSADAPGHWPARDWQSLPMRATANGWTALVPVEDLDVPIIYYVSQDTQSSPLRIVHPRKAGMTEPSRIFWPYIDGFEDSLTGWRASDASLNYSPAAHTGKRALSVNVAKRTGAISTTRVRGWQAHGNEALGLRLWVRKAQGSGRVRVSLLANALTEKQMMATFPTETPVGPRWEKIDLLFASLPPFPLPALELISVELIGPGDYLLDDLELLGRWPSELR